MAFFCAAYRAVGKGSVSKMSSDDDMAPYSPASDRPSPVPQTPAARRVITVPESTSPDEFATVAARKKFKQLPFRFMNEPQADGIADAMFPYKLRQTKISSVTAHLPCGTKLVGTGPEGMKVVADRFLPTKPDRAPAGKKQPQKSRRSFSAQQKLQLMAEANAKGQPASDAYAKFWKDHGIPSSMYVRWRKESDNLHKQVSRGDGAMTKNRGLDILTVCRDELTTAIWYEFRENLTSVNLGLLSTCLMAIDDHWCHLTLSARCMFFKRWLERHNLSVRKCSGFHQITPRDAEARVVKFYQRLSRMNAEKTIGFVVVADETQVLYNMDADTTVAPVGSTRVHAVETNAVGRKEGCTVFLAASSEGPDEIPYLFDPICIFSGRDGVLRSVDETRLRSETPMAAVDTTDSGWQTNQSFMNWIRTLPYRRHDDGLIVVDMHKSHMGDDVRAAAKARGYRIALIPAGCTSVCQVHDLVVNKPFKATLRRQYALHLKSLLDLGQGNRRLTMLEKRTRVMGWVARAYRRHDCGDPEHKPIEDSVRDSIHKHVWKAILAPPPAGAAEAEPTLPVATAPLSMSQVDELRMALSDFDLDGTDPTDELDARTMQSMNVREKIGALEENLAAASEEKMARLKENPPKPAAKRPKRDPNARVQRKPRSARKKS